MKYMTFNSSCSYAGVANMLAQYGVETDDRTIAMEMKLPYLFTRKDGVYMAGPMLQSAEWFDLYLNPIGFRMAETELPAVEAADFLRKQRTAMLGLRVDENRKHAVVYTGSRGEKLEFWNNKWEQDPSQERFELTGTELLERTGPTVMIATLEQIEPRNADISGKIRQSVPVIRQNLEEIGAVCCRAEAVGILRSKLNSLFRPLLLDGITMLDLLGEGELAEQFSELQRDLLKALRRDGEEVLVLGDLLSYEKLKTAAERYIRLILKAAE